MEEDDTIETMPSLRDEGKVRFIGMSGILPNLPDQIAMGVFDVFQIPTRRSSASTKTSITAAAATGAGTLIRGGAARGAPAEDKAWQRGPLGAGRRRRPAPLGGLRHGRPARGDDRDGVRAPLHAQPPGPVEHHRRHVQAPSHLRANLAVAEKGPLPADLYEEAKRRLEIAHSESR